MADDDNTQNLPAIISRADAKAAGLTRYFTGKPCAHGHVAERSVSGRRCLTCKVANRDRVKSRLRSATWYAKNKERAKAVGAAYEKSEERKASRAVRRAKEENKAKQKAWREAWYVVNAEKHLQKTREWQKANPDRVRAMKRNREARQRSADGRYTDADIRRIYKLQSGRCAYCKEKVGKKFHIDHIVALSKGGSNWPANLQILCPSCNCHKHAKDPLDHARSLGLLL